MLMFLGCPGRAADHKVTPRGLRNTELNASGLLASSQRPARHSGRRNSDFSPCAWTLTELHLSEMLSSSSKLPVPEVTSFCCPGFCLFPLPYCKGEKKGGRSVIFSITKVGIPSLCVPIPACCYLFPPSLSGGRGSLTNTFSSGQQDSLLP